MTLLVRLLLVVLYIFWSLAAGAAFFALIPIRYTESFRSAVYLSACRGKLWESRPPRALGPLTDWRVPQQWFGHFYIVGLAANLLLLAVHFATCRPTEGDAILSSAALLLLQIHLMRRCWETYFVFNYPKDSCMHAVAYCFGLLYYVVLPLTCYASHFLVSKIGNAANPACLIQHRNGTIVGAVIFLLGNFLQLQSHRTLARLSEREPACDSVPKNSVAHYKIPRGGAFELVSCPHYLGECVIYLGLALVLEYTQLLAWLPFLWVVANLMLAARPTHEWYCKKFENYPKQRKALIPFVY